MPFTKSTAAALAIAFFALPMSLAEPVDEWVGGTLSNVPSSTPTKILKARASSTATAQCNGMWETVTNDPVVQWWWMSVPNVQVSHSRFWDHLNLNDCAPTANEVVSDSSINGVAIKFHASEPCGPTKIGNAFRSSSNPPTNVGCSGPGSKGDSSGDAAAEGLEAALEGILTAADPGKREIV